MVAVFPGSFDPVTYGHLDIIARASTIVDKLIVAVLHNSAKNSLFTIEERVQQVKESTKAFSNVSVVSFQGLLAEFMKENNIGLIIRSTRSAREYEYESQLASINKSLFPVAETIFLATNSRYLHVSSTVVKELASYGGNLSEMVPSFIEKVLKEIYDKERV